MHRVRSFQEDNAESDGGVGSKDTLEKREGLIDEVLGNANNEHTGSGSSFPAKIAIALGIAATATVISIGLNRPVLGSSVGIQLLAEGSTSSTMATSPVGFTVKAFGYRVVLPEYAPGYALILASSSVKTLVFF